MRNFIAELQNQLNSKKAQLDALFQECKAISDERHSIWEQKREAEKKLEEVRMKITDLKTVNIFFYEDGQIELDDNSLIPSDLYANAEMIQTRLVELIQNPLAENLSIRELRSIVKLQILVKHLSVNGFTPAISFGSKEVQEFFETTT